MFVSVSAVFAASLIAARVLADGPRSECVSIWNVRHPGQTCESISSDNGVSVAQMLKLNPDLVCNGKPLAQGTRVCLSSYTPPCYAWEQATAATCDTDPMLAKWDLSRADFIAFNDNVDETTCALKLGQEYCVSENWCQVHLEECCAEFPNEPGCPA